MQKSAALDAGGSRTQLKPAASGDLFWGRNTILIIVDNFFNQGSAWDLFYMFSKHALHLHGFIDLWLQIFYIW